MTLASFAAFTMRLPILVLLILACLFLVIAIPFAASRGKLHIPGYIGIAFLAGATGFLLGWLSGAPGVQGTATGIFLSIVFFLLVATVIGSVLSLFLYRRPSEK